MRYSACSAVEPPQPRTSTIRHPRRPIQSKPPAIYSFIEMLNFDFSNFKMRKKQQALNRLLAAVIYILRGRTLFHIRIIGSELL